MLFTEDDYNEIHRLTFGTPGYAGYRPEVQESPNGDGAWDTVKRYAHVALKYDPSFVLRDYFWRAFHYAYETCDALGVPETHWPDEDECCLRILDYPPGAGSAEHTDFDFMTLQLYRDRPEGFIRTKPVDDRHEQITPGIHYGEIAELIGFAEATPHLVAPLNVRQRSIVFFVLPSRDAPIKTVGQWLDERYARSRREVK